MNGGLDDRQRAARRDRVAGTFAACAMGQDPDRTLADLWHYWSGREPGIPAELAFNGLALERPIARLAEHAYGWRLRRVGRTFIEGALAASPDFYVLGEPALVETKAFAGWLDELPPRRWHWQVVTQLAVRPDVERVELVCLVGARLRRWTFRRPDVVDDMERLAARAAELRTLFEAGAAPPPDPRDDASDVLTFAPLAPGEAEATADELVAGDALAAIVRARKACEPDEERLRRVLADALAAAGLTALHGPSWIATARSVSSGRVSLVFTVAPMA